MISEPLLIAVNVAPAFSNTNVGRSFQTMQEVVNKKMFNIKDRGVLDKYPNASATVVKVNKTTLTVELSSVDKTIDGKMFNVKPSEIKIMWSSVDGWR